MKQRQNLKVVYSETQHGLNRILDIKISTLAPEHQKNLKKFGYEKEIKKQENVLNLKLEDLIK